MAVHKNRLEKECQFVEQLKIFLNWNLKFLFIADTRQSCADHLKKLANANMVINVNLLTACTN